MGILRRGVLTHGHKETKAYRRHFNIHLFGRNVYCVSAPTVLDGSFLFDEVKSNLYHASHLGAKTSDVLELHKGTDNTAL